MSRYAWIMAGLLLAAGQGVAESEAIPFNVREFKIPIRILNRDNSIKMLELYFSTDRGKTWRRGPTALPSENNFNFQAEADGEHWFSVLIIDREGGKEPKDLYNLPVGQKILIDTTLPEINLVSARRVGSGREIEVKWAIKEKYLDLKTLKVATQSGSGSWEDATIVPKASGKATIKVGPEAVKVRVEVADTAGNLGTASTEVAAMKTVVASDRGVPVPPLTSIPPLPSPLGEEAMKEEPKPDHVHGSAGHIPPPPPVLEADPIDKAEGALATSTPSPKPATPPVAGNIVEPEPQIPIVNKNLLTLEYEVAKYGPSGIGSAEMYVTRDDGRTWERYPARNGNAERAGSADSKTMRRTLTVDLKEEGVYGLYLVVKSGAGLGKPAPTSGTKPQMKVELDTTVPWCAIYEHQVHPTQPNALILRWKATDKHLGSRPVTLEWAAQATGPWQVIGEEAMANTGSHVWPVPANIPARAYLRLSVKDLAGNKAVAQTAEPILVDLHTPEVKSLKLMGSRPSH